MTINRTTLLDLPLPVTGTESNTWGDVVNYGLTEYLDISIAGSLELSTDADVLLASTEGTAVADNIGATTAQYAVLRCTGSRTVTRNITAPAWAISSGTLTDYSKTYIVVNETTGGQNIVLRATNSVTPTYTTGVTIVPGERAVCVWNGSDFVKAGGVTGGSNTQVQYNNAGVLGGIANATSDGTTLSMTSPKVITGINDTNGNELLKVTATGSAVNELTLANAATGNAPTLSATGDDTNIGINITPKGSGVVTISNLAVTTIDATNIEVTNIKAKDGTAAATIADSTGVVSITANPVLSAGTANGVLYLNGSKVATSGSALTFDGTNLATTGTATATKLIPTGNVTAGNGMYLPTTNTLAWSNNGSETMRLDSSGNLGLGVTPSAWDTSIFKALQVGKGSALFGDVRSAQAGNTGLSGNVYYGSGAFRYINNNFAGQYFFAADTGIHSWSTAPSGTAGNAISFTQAMTLDASGRLGVGATTINAQMVIGGVGGYSVGGNRNTLQLRNSNSSGNQSNFFVFGSAGTESSCWIVNDLAANGTEVNVLSFGTNNTERMRLDSSGNLGLGVTPSAWGASWRALELPNGVAYTSAFGVNYQATNAYHDGTNWIYKTSSVASFYQNGAGAHSWYIAPSGTAGNAITFTQAMTLTSGGALLVGQTAIKTSEVVRVGAGVQSSILLDNSGNTNGAIVGAYNDFAVLGVNRNPSTGVVYDATKRASAIGLIGSSTDSYIAFETATAVNTAPTERARITSGGAFYVGTTTAPTATAPQQVVKSGASDWVSYVWNSNAAPYGLRVQHDTDTNGTGNQFLFCAGSPNLRAEIRSNGGLANYSANDVNLSDRREKTNFAPAKSYLDTICAIPVQTFNYIDQSENDPGLTLGVVAQDVQAVAPELVMESNWGTEDNPKMRLSIYQTDLQYALMKCIQEQQALIQSLTARVALLEGN